MFGEISRYNLLASSIHSAISNGSLVISIKPKCKRKCKCKFRAAAVHIKLS